LDLQKKEVAGVQSEEHRRAERRLARGLEDVSHLFLTQPSNRPAEKAEEQSRFPEQTASESVKPPIPVLLRSSPDVNRELLISLLNDNAAVLEEGLRTIDANVPCAPFGSMDLLALGNLDQFSVIHVDTLQNDVSLLRGIAHVDWLVRNMPLVRRMHQGRAINFSIPPRLFLVAPGFSPLLQCVAPRIISPRISCFAYRAAMAAAGVGILFERT
jgi:hypothetical protein